MGVIVVTVLVEGPRVSADRRGPLKGSIFINNGVFQAIGVISFGKRTTSCFNSHTDLSQHLFVVRPYMNMTTYSDLHAVQITTAYSFMVH